MTEFAFAVPDEVLSLATAVNVEASGLIGYGGESKVGILAQVQVRSRPADTVLLTKSHLGGACRHPMAAVQTRAWNRLTRGQRAMLWPILSMGELRTNSRVAALAFSPDSKLEVAPEERSVALSFTVAAACADRRIRIFAGQCAPGEALAPTLAPQVILRGHDEPVNDVVFLEPNLLASVSDDCACLLWDLRTGDTVASYRASASAVAVRAHAQDPGLLVADASGVLRRHDMRQVAPTLSLRTPQPLMAADWAPARPTVLGALCGTRWLVYDAVSGRERDTGRAHPEGGRWMRFAPTSADVFATASAQHAVSLWNTAHPSAPLAFTQRAPVMGLGWLAGQRWCVSAGGRSLHFRLSNLE